MNANEEFQYYRHKLGLSKTQIAKALKITPAAITNFENGKIQPSKQTIEFMRYIVHFGILPSEITKEKK